MNCKYCGTYFIPNSKKQLYCSKQCAYAWHEHKMSKAEWDSIKTFKSLPITDPQAYLDRYGIDLDYVSGWKGTAYKCTVRCRVCGYEYLANMDNVRKGSTTHCPECERKQRQLKVEAKAIQKEIAYKQKQEQIKLNKQKRIDNRENKKRTVICDMCGSLFITYKKKTNQCSDKCRKKYWNSYSSRKREERLKGVKRDYGISARSLMIKENGICYLCGGRCDLNDYTYNDNGVFIAGNNYPSVEHVIPICFGGTDTWSNVRLAHRICNSRKNDNINCVSFGDYEQLALF